MHDMPDNELVRPILDWFREYGVIHTFEPSFKLGYGQLSTERGLFGFNKGRLGNEPDRLLVEFCIDLGMPEELVQIYRQELRRSGYVGFGYESDGNVQRFKAYLDFSSQLEAPEEPKLDSIDSGRLFLGFKWLVSGEGASVVTEYRNYPLLTHREMRERSLDILGAFAPARALMETAFEVCRRNWPDRPLEYMEAREAGNARISFDIKFYSTSFTLSSLLPSVLALGKELHIGDKLPAFLAKHATSSLGHLAGGLDRAGQPFLMVYHGVRRRVDPRVDPFLQAHAQLGSAVKDALSTAAGLRATPTKNTFLNMPITSPASPPAFRYDPQRQGWYAMSGETSLMQLASGLDGVLTLEKSALGACADDYGHIVHQEPVAVLRPGSIEDVVKVVGFAYRNDIRLAARGNAFNTYGQSQARAGIVIDMSSLHRVHAISSEYAVVDAGITWRDLLLATLAEGLTPVVLTDFIGTTVGGTLSVGGFGGTTYLHGGQVDHALELQVVTGKGELVTCSETENPTLFQVALGGLGLCGIIVRATIRLQPAKTHARTHRMMYMDLSAMLKDLRYLVDAGRFSHLRGHAEVLRGKFAYFIEATSFYTAPDELPAQPYLGLAQQPGEEGIKDRTFFEYADLVVEAIAALEEAGLGNYPHPWLDLIVPDTRIEELARQVIATLDPARILPGSPILFYPMQCAKLTRKLPAMPSAAFCWGFDVLRTVPPHPGLVMQVIDQNQRFFELNRAMGGRLYPISAVRQHRQDWKKNFAPHWDSLQTERAVHDPRNLFGHALGL